MTAPTGISTSSPPSSVDASTVLETAHKYQGWPYGGNAKEMIDTTLIVQVLTDLGMALDDAALGQLTFGSGAPSDDMITKNDPSIEGVELALIKANLGEKVSIEGAQPGDFVQYWWLDGGVWKRNAAIIDKVKGSGIFDLFGAHNEQTGVSVLADQTLSDPAKKVFIVRLKYSSVQEVRQSLPGSGFNAMLVLGSRDPEIRKNRVNGAYDLFSKGSFDTVVVSGGCGAHGGDASNCEAQDMARMLREKGIPAEKIFIEGEAGDTKQNYRFSRDLTRPDGSRVIRQSDRLVVVSDHPHVRAVAYCFKYLDKIDASYYRIGSDSAPQVPSEGIPGTSQDYIKLAEECKAGQHATSSPVQSSAGSVAASSSQSSGNAASSGASPPSSGATGCGKKIVAIGDSITVSKSYVDKLRLLCPDTDIRNEDGDASNSQNLPKKWPAGVTGDKFAYVGKSTAAMAKDFNTALSLYPAETVIILGGTNDIEDKAPTDKLLEMISYAKGKGMRVVSVTIPPYMDEQKRKTKTVDGKTVIDEVFGRKTLENIKTLNSWILSAENPADLKVDIYSAMVSPSEADAANPELFGGDLVHPGPRGQEIMAQLIHARLTGSPVPSTTQAGEAAAAGAVTASAVSQITCIPESVLPTTLYDFIIDSSAGFTKIVGIARQNIAIGINKTVIRVSAGANCFPISATKDYDLAFLEKTYGKPGIGVEAQLQDGGFMGQSVQMHRLILPALGCVEQEAKSCPEAGSYDFRTVDSYQKDAVAEDPRLVSTGSFGISVNINLDTNPNDQSGVSAEDMLQDIPDCVVNAFKKYGFVWGGDFETVKSPAHFEFMADPSQIVIQQGITCSAGTTLVVEDGVQRCRPAAAAATGIGEVTVFAGENGEAKKRFAQAIAALGGALPYDEVDKHPTCCADWTSRVYRWSGYTYLYGGTGDYTGLDDIAKKHGYPISYNDNRGSAGHALILLGFGPDANWWLEKFPDIPLPRHARSVGENEALVISYLGAVSKKVEFWVYPRDKYPERIKSTKTGVKIPAKITFVHPLTPLCEGEYVKDEGTGKYGGKYAGMMYWKPDQAGGSGNPWSKYWEPDTPYYPKGGNCQASTSVA
jgi:lysophospholipase L1-like esterase